VTPRVVVALTTPFDAGGGVDLGAVRAHVEWLAAAGVDGVMPCGTTGEGPLLRDDEVEQVVAACVSAAGAVDVLAHVGRPDTASTLELARAAEAAGARAVSAVVPYYYALDDAQVERHFRALLGAATVPAYAYTIPARDGNELRPGVVRSLAAAGLRGVKDSTKSWDRHVELLACGLDVLIGTDGMVGRAFAAGAAGCVSALANVRPDLLCALRDGGGADAEEEILHLRARLPMQRLKSAVAEAVPGYPAAYRAPLGIPDAG
jgi:dihydrodipicolinate synthase/N-acetylneuraminate lyase